MWWQLQAARGGVTSCEGISQGNEAQGSLPMAAQAGHRLRVHQRGEGTGRQLPAGLCEALQAQNRLSRLLLLLYRTPFGRQVLRDDVEQKLGDAQACRSSHSLEQAAVVARQTMLQHHHAHITLLYVWQLQAWEDHFCLARRPLPVPRQA